MTRHHTEPSGLRAQQHAFTRSLAGAAPPSGILGGVMSADARIAVYRHNVAATQAAALVATYPVVQAIVGEEFFATLAKAFPNEHPSRSGDVSRYGENFASFLAGYDHATALNYLPDVARLEWARHRALVAADSASLDLARIAAVPALSQAAIHFHPNPSLSLIASPFPLDEIWRVNQHDYRGEMALDWDDAPKYFAVFRPEWEANIARLGAGHFAFLSALTQGAALADALEIAINTDAHFDLQAALATSAGERLIVGFSV